MDRTKLKEIGKWCKGVRELHGVAQIDVAHELGVTRSHISKFETGKTDSGIILLWYIKKRLGYDDKRDIK